MSKLTSTRTLLLLLIAALLLTACATTTTPPQPASATIRYLIDPRIGFTGTTTNAQQRRFDAAWRAFQRGQWEDVETRFNVMLAANRNFLPAQLGLVAAALEQEKFDVAESLLGDVEKAQPIYYTADVYHAELDARRGRLESAYNRYTDLISRPDAPDVLRARFEDLRNQLFASLLARANSETSAERSTAYLRQALMVRPDASAARMLLVNKLIALGRYDDARKQIEPLLASDDMQVETQEALVDIDVGRGRYEDAIARLEKLDRVYPDPKYRERLEQIKTTWAETNLPAQYHSAIGSEAITRADLAVLLFWKITAVRFAQNLPEPPIATDIGAVVGREELVRALALRLYSVDPITRQVYPDRVVSGSSFMKTISRLAQFRGATCAEAARSEVNESARAGKVFENCELPTGALLSSPEVPVSGRFAADVLDRLERLPSGK